MKYVLLEMDRILRPTGHAIIRESTYFVDTIATIAKGMRWICRKENTEYGVEKEKILICQKKLWQSSSSRWQVLLLEQWWEGVARIVIPEVEAKGNEFKAILNKVDSFYDNKESVKFRFIKWRIGNSIIWFC